MLAEPITTLTDYAIAAEALIFSVLLSRQPRPEWVWIVAFGGVAIAALCGGTYHGFPELPHDWRWGLWRGITYGLSLTSACLLLASVGQVARRWRVWCWGAIGFKTVLYLSWTIFNHSLAASFASIIADYLSALLIFLGVQLWALVQGKAGAVWMIAGVIGSLLAVLIQALSINLTEQVNHNDLYHGVQMVALFLFYKGLCVKQYNGNP
jgi:hypothetical protein